MKHVSIPELAVGRWQEILPALGIERKYLKKRQGPCPHCGGADRFRFDDLEGRGSFYCNQCGGAGDGFKLLQRVWGWDFREACNEVAKIVAGREPIQYHAPDKPSPVEVNKELAKLWAQAEPLKLGDPVLAYLLSRGIRPMLWRNLRYLRDRHCMLALYRDHLGNPTTLHTTPLPPHGGKKLFAKDAPVSPGGAVFFQSYSDTLGISEGLETAMSAAQIHNVPCCAALTADLLSRWEPPEGIRQVIIFGDNDPSFVGQAASYILARRLAARRIEVEVCIPQTGDWNDALRATVVALTSNGRMGDPSRAQQSPIA